MRGVATGIGSLPYDDIDEALRVVFDELPDLPHLPELPGRGAGADLTGRAAALLVDLHADLQPAGWRLVDRPGRDERRAVELLVRDLDALELHAFGYAGPLKVQVAGPWTLAATMELNRGDKALGDPGAVRDVASSLAEGVRDHLTAVRARVPGAEVWLQVDEPALPAVLAGRVPTASGYRAFPPADESLAVERLREVLEAGGERTVVHCCGDDPPMALARRAGAAVVSVDAARLSTRDDDEIGELVEGGAGLWLGLVPALGHGASPTVAQVAAPARALWRRLAFDPERLADVIGVTPACGLAGASGGWVRSALGLCREAARALDEAPEERA